MTLAAKGAKMSMIVIMPKEKLFSLKNSTAVKMSVKMSNAESRTLKTKISEMISKCFQIVRSKNHLVTFTAFSERRQVFLFSYGPGSCGFYIKSLPILNL